MHPEEEATSRQEQQERRARRFWCTAIVGMLGLQIAVGITAIVLASGDASVAIVPDYHAKALKWDERREAFEAVRRHGWQIHADLSAELDELNRRRLTVMLTDVGGRGVDGLRVTVQLYHHARGSQIQEVELQQDATPLDRATPGRYSADVSAARPGLWQIGLLIKHPDGTLLRWEGTTEVHRPARPDRSPERTGA